MFSWSLLPTVADGRHAVGRNAPHFGRRQFQQRHRAFARNQLRLRAGRTRHLRAFAGPQFNVVDDGAGGNILEGQGIADQDVGFGSGRNRGADHQTFGRDDVALLAIRIVQQRDARRTVRIVFDRGDFRRNAEFVALEIDDPVSLLVAARDEARSHAARYCCGRPTSDAARPATFPASLW